MKVSALTHYDPIAQEACALWCLAIRRAVFAGELNLRAGIGWLPESSQARWTKWVDEAEQRDPRTFTPNGYVVSALQAAWAAIVQTPVPTTSYSCLHLTDALETAIRIGDDTDTVASIAGALLGARWGMSAIPAEWRRILHGYPHLTGRDLERLAYLAARGGRAGKYGWPNVDHIDYEPLQYGDSALAAHPHDDGVHLAGATVLDALPIGTDAVVSLCLTGRLQVPDNVEHITFRIMDQPGPAENPHLDFALLDAAQTVARLRDEGKVVVLHCVAAHSRTPTVGVLYAMLRGVPLAEAMTAVCAALPSAYPNAGFRKALERLSMTMMSE